MIHAFARHGMGRFSVSPAAGVYSVGPSFSMVAVILRVLVLTSDPLSAAMSAAGAVGGGVDEGVEEDDEEEEERVGSSEC